MTPQERTLRARTAAHTKWARTEDPSAATLAARQGFDKRFLEEVDPDGTLPLAERERRAESARKAYFARLALRSARSRRKAKEAREVDVADADAELTAEQASTA